MGYLLNNLFWEYKIIVIVRKMFKNNKKYKKNILSLIFYSYHRHMCMFKFLQLCYQSLYLKMI